MTLSFTSFPKTASTLATLAAAALLAPSAAHASQPKPTIVMVHRNIKNAQDESNWIVLANNLSSDGFHVVTIGLAQNGSATEGKGTIMNVIDAYAAGHPVLLVGTAAVSEPVELAASQAPAKVQGAVYISAADAFASFGPRTISVPAEVSALVPTYQVRITRSKQAARATEDGITTFKVREEGRTTLPNLSDLQDTIESVAAIKPTSAKA